MLKARFELGELDPLRKVSWSRLPKELLACDEHDALALEMARETMTLLQNRNDVLPLSKEKRYAVVGPNAADSLVLWGNYNGTPRKTVTVLEGITSKLGVENVVYAKGCEIAESIVDTETGTDSDMSIFNDVDAIIYVGGLSPQLEGEEMQVDFKGFRGGDRTSIELPKTQREYISALAATGKPVVFVNLSGSAVALAPEAEHCDAILQAWYGGQQGGQAVADVLFGDYNPAGRLPVTFYASDSDLPDFSDYDMEGHTYRYFKGKPLFPFGHGLSYSEFAYGEAVLAEDMLSIPVTNTSKTDGDEVVQVYLRRNDDIDGPLKSLRGFRRVHIKAGETVVVEMPMAPEDIDLFNPATGTFDIPSGAYTFYYGGTSDES